MNNNLAFGQLEVERGPQTGLDTKHWEKKYINN